MSRFRAGAETVVCPSCAGSRCEIGECEPCMHGDCPDRCIDDICRGSGWHVDCHNCEGTGRNFIRTTAEWREPSVGKPIDWSDPASETLTRTEANGGLEALAREGRGALGRILPNPGAES